MEIREVSLNVVGWSSKSGGPPLATYISPPRPNRKKSAAAGGAAAAAVAAASSGQLSSTHMETAVNMSSSPHAYSASPSPWCMELTEMDYAQCPCATCAHYRRYYAMQMAAGAVPNPSTAPPYAASTAYMQGAYTLQQQHPPTTPSQGDVASAMVIGAHRHATHVMSPSDASPLLQEQEQQQPMLSAMYSKPGVMAHGPAVVPLDAAEEFERMCVGRVAELACSAEGRTMLLAAMCSQDAGVIDRMVNEIAADVERVALDNNGCHVLRALEDYMNAEQTALLVSSFNETLVLNLCTVSQYTRRILQALFERPLIDLQPVVDVLAANTQYLAATQQGCISLMRVFERCSEEQKAQLMAPLFPLFAHIALDPFGNYVVQCVIEHSGMSMAAKYTVMCFAGEFLNMSCSKYASNVVEKIIKVCGDVPAVRRLLMDELIYNPAALLQMVQDNFGNFVVQSIIEHTENPSELKRICDRLRPALPSSPYAAKIEAKLRTKHLASRKHYVGSQQQRAQAPRQGAVRRLQQQQQQQQQ